MSSLKGRLLLVLAVAAMMLATVAGPAMARDNDHKGKDHRDHNKVHHFDRGDLDFDFDFDDRHFFVGDRDFDDIDFDFDDFDDDFFFVNDFDDCFPDFDWGGPVTPLDGCF